MKIKEAIVLFLILFVAIILLLHYMNATSSDNHSTSKPTGLQLQSQQGLLHKLLRDQNDTIQSLSHLLRAHAPFSDQYQLQELHTEKHGNNDKSDLLFEIDNLKKQLQDKDILLQNLNSKVNVNSYDNSNVGRDSISNAMCDTKIKNIQNNMKSTNCDRSLTGGNEMRGSRGSSSNSYIDESIMSSIEKDCDDRYGIGLLKNWKATKQEWCSSNSKSNGIKSSLTCYPYQQLHKKRDGRGADLVCEGTNLLIDFTKISGQVSSTGKPAKGNQYLSFQKENIVGFCDKTPSFRESLFMPHHKLQMSGFVSKSNSDTARSVKHIDTTTYLLARDEDCENTFHSTADFMNMYFVMSMLGISPSEQQVILWDKYTNGPYYELIQKAYSPNHNVLRHTDYSGQVLFKRVVFHLESPAGLIFPKVANPPGSLRCKAPALFNSYRKFVLEAFGLYDQNPPAIPTVTVSLRKRTSAKNVGRVMQNEQEVENVLKQGNMIHYRMADFGGMSFYEQLKIIRSTNILVGVHGAGLMFIMFAAEEAILIEIHPSYRLDRHFRHAARMTGKIYMPVRSQQRETCVGSSDNVMVPISEFKSALDGAIRIARSFDDGLAECGLDCPNSILALDKSVDAYYGVASHSTKGKAQNTRFPC